MRDTTANVMTCLPIRRREMCLAGSRHPSLAAKRTTDHRPLATGFTLIEMLVVVTIMMIMVAAAATMMQPASDSRRLRETARAVNVYLSSARNRAMETGRPCGVVFRAFRDAVGNPILPCAMTADQCEMPPSYCGAITKSCASVTALSSTSATVAFSDGSAAEVLPNYSVRPNDLIQLGAQGPYYYIESSSVDTNGYLSNVSSVTAKLVDPSQVQVLPWTATAAMVPYRIFRAPVKAAATPLQLPASAVVDLAWSGDGSGYLDTTTAMDYTVMFSPNGSVECVYAGAARSYITQPIFLLIGKRERVGQSGSSSANPGQWGNWQDPAGYWVVVNPQTGMVSTGNVAVASKTDGTIVTDALTGVPLARSLAAQAQSIGGK